MNTTKEHRIRCQYQKGNICISVCKESDTPISSADMIYLLAELAVKVKDETNKKLGGKVALKVLWLHEKIIRDIHSKKLISNGESRSFYLDRRNKNKTKRSERIDVEVRGICGVEDPNNPINRYILGYRKLKQWETIL